MRVVSIIDVVDDANIEVSIKKVHCGNIRCWHDEFGCKGIDNMEIQMNEWAMAILDLDKFEAK